MKCSGTHTSVALAEDTILVPVSEEAVPASECTEGIIAWFKAGLSIMFAAR